VSLEVWREPKRGNGLPTPDLVVATVGELSRDLLVVEAKDRHAMPSGLPAPQVKKSVLKQKVRQARATGTALGVAGRYAGALRPFVTWVCNHCDFQDDPNPLTNHGDPWTRVHLAARFRPGSVPDAFTRSVRSALEPPDEAWRALRTSLTVVLDATSSMPRDSVESSLAALAKATQGRAVGPFRAVLYSDHGKPEPFLVRKLGPFSDVDALVDAVNAQPRGYGGDLEEALEDAMQRCREIVDDVGPHAVLVITDAPPHSQSDCPYGIDFAAEVAALLAAGCTLYVATDWREAAWQPFMGNPGFRAAPLGDLVGMIVSEQA
jgi:hypothetical protein